MRFLKSFNIYIFILIIFILNKNIYAIDNKNDVNENCPHKITTLEKWSNLATWKINNKLPVVNQNINITGPILLDISPPALGTIRITGSGMLVWDHKQGLELRARSIMIYDGGQLIIGSEQCKFKYKTSITIYGESIHTEVNQTIEDGLNLDFGQKVIGIGHGGTIELHGETPKTLWTKLNETANPSNQIITVLDEVSDWPVGSELVFASTDFDMYQTETNYIEPCKECKKNQIKLKNPLKYSHWGNITKGIDERGEVGLLTRNIKIQGSLGTSCVNSPLVCEFFKFDTFGAHIMIQKDFKNAHFQGVELFQVGQSHVISRYPIHFHMCGRVDEKGGYEKPAYIQNCSVHKSFSRCYVIHGTHGLLVNNNIGFDSIGHCYMLCDGIEMDNIITNNLGLLTKAGLLFPHDRSCEMCKRVQPYDFNGNPTQCTECEAVSTFWISNANNHFVGNVAAGSESAGIWYIFPEYPTGLSHNEGVEKKIKPYLIPARNFTNNVAHSNTNGLQIDSGIKITPPSIKNPEQLGAIINGRYKPRSDPTDINSDPTPSIFDGGILYKNRWRGGWARGGHLIFKNFQIADNAIGFTLASEGTTPEDPAVGQQMYNSLFVGETDNKGQASNKIPLVNGRSYPFGENTLMPIRGFEIYDGTTTLENITFQYFQVPASMPQRNISAIGFFRVDDWQDSSKSGFRNLRFYKVDKEIHFESSLRDGDKTSTIRDLDGSLTSIPNTVLTRNLPFYKTNKCKYIPKWNGLVCKENTAQLFICNGDSSITNYNGKEAGIVAIKNNDPNQFLGLEGTPTHSPKVRFQYLVYKGHHYDFHFPHPTPHYLRIQPMNWEISENFTIGVCIGISTGIELKVTKTSSGTDGNSNNVRELYPTNSKSQITESTYYFDPITSILYAMYYQDNPRLGDNYCPSTGCEELVVRIYGPNYGRVTGDCQTLAYHATFTIFDEKINDKFKNTTQIENNNFVYNSSESYRGEIFLQFNPSPNNQLKFECDQCIPSTGIKYLELWVNGGKNSSSQNISIKLLTNNNNINLKQYNIDINNFQNNSWTLVRIPFKLLKILNNNNNNSSEANNIINSVVSFNGILINSGFNQSPVYLDNIKFIYDN
ncbi:hypothetical protein DICPUDRAFT_98926 [Dictyostelium purpureum]|uniref:G8 domain-containing protein n=1 Tax=Dictyostelium purpureum TaxID=5786 RepID=F0ZUU5_DICPU|nr:uncharacterized protein DICPUDRAFT_98926 [Dictyostelium purpureum]EGC32284.1 hypothetical protein DICPUDRAFT_98926 [Dictyostelium purpureum]|eukprot:XP_003291193.1 hypothetical protein DICPUDRAFT_98926 [Dictyostelium purpureum]